MTYGNFKDLNRRTGEKRKNLRKEKYTHLLQTIFGGADLADIQLISKFNKRFRLSLCVIDIYVRVIPLKDKKALQLLMLFKF